MGNGTIDANGLFQGTSPGMATVRATLGAISGSTSVSIEAPDQGYGAWLSGKYQGYIDAIVAYNNSQADPQLGGEDRLLGKGTVAALPPGGEANLTVNLSLPKDLAPGTYYLGAVADPLGKVGESDETNNLAVSGPIVVTGKP